MRIRVILPCAVMLVLRSRGMWRQFLQPDFVVMEQPALIVIDKYRGGDVHRIDETQSLLDPAFPDQLFNRLGDIYESSAIGNLEPQMFCERLHAVLNSRGSSV